MEWDSNSSGSHGCLGAADHTAGELRASAAGPEHGDAGHATGCEAIAGPVGRSGAPIALYPDPMLSQVLVASTYPLELVEAQQWLQHNSGLKGQALMDAARQQNWDASIQAMVAFSDVLAKLNQDVQ